MAMESRCYRGDKNRTKLVKLSYRFRDFVWFFIVLLFLGSIITLKILPNHVAFTGEIFPILFYKI
jgi:energy-coupling factor transporter transmembrane protein EcfT